MCTLAAERVNSQADGPAELKAAQRTEIELEIEGEHARTRTERKLRLRAPIFDLRNFKEKGR